MIEIKRRGFFGLLLGAGAAVVSKPAAAKAVEPIPDMRSGYVNRSVRNFMDIQTIKDRNYLISVSDYTSEPADWRYPVRLTNRDSPREYTGFTPMYNIRSK